VKIRSVHYDNRREAFRVGVSRSTYWFPYAKAHPRPSSKNLVASVYVDEELGNEAFTYELASGQEGTVHIDQVLDYNRDPRYLRDLLVYQLTLAARQRVESSPLSKRELIRRLGTSAAQFYRLLDPTNYTKSIDQLTALLGVLDCEVELIVRSQSRAAVPGEVSYIVGVDLSGPTNTHDTAVAVFAVDGDGLRFVDSQCDGSDASLLARMQALAREGWVVVGLDAPLSYQPGGGQRDRDAQLRKRVVGRGMHPGSIMAPTLNRMVYLTLRGIVVAHLLSVSGAGQRVRIVEVHPGAALCLRGAPPDAVRDFAQDEPAREVVLRWLASRSVRGIRAPAPCSSHFVAACACALAAWDWHREKSRWLAPAEPPWHPYDFAS